MPSMIKCRVYIEGGASCEVFDSVSNKFVLLKQSKYYLNKHLKLINEAFSLEKKSMFLARNQKF